MNEKAEIRQNPPHSCLAINLVQGIISIKGRP
jgi:hypothetical protein